MVDTGQKTEAIILAQLVRDGYSVSIPFGYNHRYDLVVDTEGEGLLRAQCKTGWVKDGCVRFNGCSTRDERKYEDEADVFLIYCPELDRVYSYPVEAAGLKPYFRIDPPKNGQTKGIRWAKDHEGFQDISK